MHTRNFICGVVIVGIVLICKKKLSWIVLLFICPSLYGSNIHRFSEFKNFNSTYYNSETGKPALSFYFKEISKESPKIGFFKFSIPFFYVEDLIVKIEMENMESQSLIKDIKEYHKKQAIRFLQARNVKIQFHLKGENNLFISANSMKLRNNGSYHFGGNVKVKINSKTSEFSSLSLIFSKGNEPYSLTNQNEQTVLKIFESFHSTESEVLSKP